MTWTRTTGPVPQTPHLERRTATDEAGTDRDEPRVEYRTGFDPAATARQSRRAVKGKLVL